MPPLRLRQPTAVHPLAATRRDSPCWSGQALIDSARYTYAYGLLDTRRATEGSARIRYSV